MEQRHVENLSLLYHFMRGLVADDFTMNSYTHGCGTPACALGWACTIPELKKQGLDISKLDGNHTGMPSSMARNVFGEYGLLFSCVLGHKIKTPQQWADHCIGYLRGQGHDVLPLKNPDEFKQFMERVLKPVPEATPDFCGYVERFPAA